MYSQTAKDEWNRKLQELEVKKKRNYYLTTALLSVVAVFQIIFTVFITISYFNEKDKFLAHDLTTDPVGNYQVWLMPVAIIFEYIMVAYTCWALFVMVYRKNIQETYRHSIIGSIYIAAFLSFAVASPVLYMHWSLFLCHAKNNALDHYESYIAFAGESILFVAIPSFFMFVLGAEVALLIIKRFILREIEICEHGENKSMVYLDQGVDGEVLQKGNITRTVIMEPVVAPKPLPITFADTSTMPLPANSKKINWKVEDKNAMLDGKIWRDIDYSGQLAQNNRNQIIRNKEKQALSVKENEQKTRILTPFDPEKTQALNTIDQATRDKIWKVDDVNAKMNGQIWRRDKFSSRISDDKRNNIGMGKKDDKK